MMAKHIPTLFIGKNRGSTHKEEHLKSFDIIRMLSTNQERSL